MKYVKAAKKEVTDRKIPTAQNRSRAALHIFETGHSFNKETGIKLLRNIKSQAKLNVAESLEIRKHSSPFLLNGDEGPGNTWLFKFLPKKREAESTDNTATGDGILDGLGIHI